jgi:hypothetical protein
MVVARELAGGNLELLFNRQSFGQALVAHACNPSYSGGRDRRIVVGSQPGQIIRETISKKPFAKKGWWSGSRHRS